MADLYAEKQALEKSFGGINHIKLPCFSIQRTLDFYTKILPFEHLPQYDHFTPDHRVFAKMFRDKATSIIVEVRYMPHQAQAQKGWDPITWSVSTRKDLELWTQGLDKHQVRRSNVFTGIKGWVMGCEDPDGRVVRLYVSEEVHEWTDHPDQDEYWLGSIEADPALVKE